MRWLPTILFLFTLFAARAQELFPVLHLSTEEGLLQRSVTTIAEDQYGRIWFGGPGGLQFYGGNQVETVEALKGESILALHADEEWMLCLGISGFWRIRVSDLYLDAYPFTENDFRDAYFLADATVIVGTKGDTITIDGSHQQVTNTKRELPVEQEYLMAGDTLVNDRYTIFHQTAGKRERLFPFLCTSGVLMDENRLFLASYQGLISISRQAGNWQTKAYFEEFRVDCLFKDRSGNLWMGTAEDGLFLFHRNSFQLHFQSVIDPDGNEVPCWSFIPDGGSLYLATSAGLMDAQHPMKRNALLEQTVGLSVFSGCSAHGTLVLGTTQGIYTLSEEQGLKRTHFNANSALDNLIMQVLQVPTGFVAISKHSIIYLDQEGRVEQQKDYSTFLPSTYIMNMQPRVEGGWIAAATTGVYYLREDFSIEHSFDLDEARVFYQSTRHENAYWSASFDGGLYRELDGQMTAVPCPMDNLISITSADHHLWIFGLRGMLQRLDSAYIAYTPSNGFPTVEYAQNGLYVDPEGRIHQSAVGGFLRFNPEKLPADTVMPQLLLKQDQGQLETADVLPLAYDQSQLLLKPEPVLLAAKDHYALELQTDSGWNAIASYQTHAFPIDYGQQKLTVRLRNTYTGRVRQVSLVVQRAIPWWLTVWFKVVAAFGGVLLLVGCYFGWRFAKTRKLLRSEKSQRQVVEERLRISRELHDNIGARLTYIISSLDLEAHRQQEKNGLQNINGFARETMDQLRETIWAVGNQAIFLSEFVHRVQQYVDRSDELAAAGIVLEQSHYPDFSLTPVETINYYRVIQEALNNAVKYAQATHVVVHISVEEQQICLSVKDDGRGFDLNNAARGAGLTNMRVRTEESGGVFEMNSAEGAGTQISIRFLIREQV